MRPSSVTSMMMAGLLMLCNAVDQTPADETEKFGTNPYKARQKVYEPDLLIVGGSSGGTAAALTAGRLGIKTLLVMRSPRELGGLTTNGVNPDSDLPIRVIGGLALELDVVARYTTGHNVGARHKHGGEGYFAPFHVFFNHIRHDIDRQKSLTVVAGYYPVSVKKDPATRRVVELRFQNRLDSNKEIVVRPKITIDAEIEGDVAFLAGVTMTLRREGRSPSADPTRNLESYAGRIFTPLRDLGGMISAGGPLLEASTGRADDTPATMAWNGTVTLEDYGEGDEESPWILVRPPRGYDAKDFAWLRKERIYGVYLGDGHRRWNCDRYLSTVEGWRLPDGRHVLESLEIADREANEREHLARTIRGLYYVQHVLGLKQFGLCRHDFYEGLEPKYRLSDFGTATNAGDAPLPSLIYMREGRRMVNDHVVGGKLMEDQGRPEYVQKTFWHPRSVYFNAMVIDIHGVHRETVPGSGPEGMQLLRLAGHPKFGAPCLPFDVFVPRPSEATGLLVAAAGAYTHQAYAAFPRMETGRIVQGHACAVAAYHALCDGVPVHKVDVDRVQLTLLDLHGQSLVYFEDTLPGTGHQVIAQMLGCRGVPLRNDNGVYQSEMRVTAAEVKRSLKRLFQEQTTEPIPEAQLERALKLLGGDGPQPATRQACILAVSAAAGIEPADIEPPVFQDVGMADFPRLAGLLAAWQKRGYLQGGPDRMFQPEEPIRFSELQTHLFNVLFAGKRRGGPIPVDYRTILAHDTFNRSDGRLVRDETGRPYQETGTWIVSGGKVRVQEVDATRYLLVDAGRADVDVSCDVFLEQSLKDASAGLVFRGRDAANLSRFLLTAERDAVRIRWDRLQAGRHVTKVSRVQRTLKRGFTLRVRCRGSQAEYYLDGKRVRKAQVDPKERGTLVGVLNGGGMASWFDNFDVRAAAAENDEKSAAPYLKRTFIISGHRAGGRVHAPDNSMPNVLFAIKNGLTAVEVDLSLTKDGKLVLWHDYSLPKRYIEPGATRNIAVNALSSEQVSRIRYSATVGGKRWEGVKIVFADDLVTVTKGKINLGLDVKNVPVVKVIEFIRKHKIQKECMVMASQMEYLQKVHRAEPDVCLEYADNTLGRREVNGKWKWYSTEKQHELYHALMKRLSAAGIDAFCTKGLTKKKVAICHQYGIMVRTSAGNLKPGVKPDRYLGFGVDYALTDDPQLMRKRVIELRPGVALTKPGQTFFDLIRGKADH